MHAMRSKFFFAVCWWRDLYRMHRALLPSVAVACQTGAIPIHVNFVLVFVNDNRGGHWVLLIVVSVVV